MATEAEWIDAGLLDPSAPNADARRQLLAWIESHGMSIAAMVDAASIGQLNSLVGDRTLRGAPELTVDDVAERTGLDVDAVQQLRRALGFPPAAPTDRVYSVSELEMFGLFAAADSFFSRDELLHFVRVMASSLRRIAEAANEMFLRDVEAPLHQLHERPRDELALAKANLAAVHLVDNVTSVFGPVFRAELHETALISRRARASACDYTTLPLTIGFVDLSGFTTRVAELPTEEVLRMVVAFETASLDLVSQYGGRLIKLIGDEVMFSTVEPQEACNIALGLLARAEKAGVTARGGLAYGSVVTSGGDVYGTPVNLASRITDAAVSGEVLVDDAVRERAADTTFEPAGRRQLKGFSEPVRLWSVSR